MLTLCQRSPRPAHLYLPFSSLSLPSHLRQMIPAAGPVTQRASPPTIKQKGSGSTATQVRTSQHLNCITLTLFSCKNDPFHGHERIARLAGHFVGDLFACPDPPASAPDAPVRDATARDAPAGKNPKPPRLDHFIAYALHRTRLPESVTYASLFLLQRLKKRFPAAKGSSGHRLFISAFIVSSKVICDDTYSNKSWTIVAQGLFQLREINQMEREMCSYLEWQLCVDKDTLKDFTARVQKYRTGPTPQLSLIIPTNSSSAASDRGNLATFGQSGIYALAQPTELSSHAEPAMRTSSPRTPEDPSPTSVSPASIASPCTPTDIVTGDNQGPIGNPEISHFAHSHSSPERSSVSTQGPNLAAGKTGDRSNAIIGAPGSRKFWPSPTMRSRSKVGRDMYAYAEETIW